MPSGHFSFGALNMKLLLPLLLCMLLLSAGSVVASPAEVQTGEDKNCRMHNGKTDCEPGPAWCKSGEGACRPEMRGRCGKRRGDWYGASQPVATAAEARGLLQSYFAGQEYTVSEVSEKKWGFRAEIRDRNGKVVDRVMIDKRSGRIRSIE
jgi:hypothetical protein